MAPIAASMNGNQPGDPRLGIARMVDVIKAEGMAKGKTITWRIPIGTDAVEIIRGRCEETLKVISEWEELSMSTDFPGPKLGYWAELEKTQKVAASQGAK